MDLFVTSVALACPKIKGCVHRLGCACCVPVPRPGLVASATRPPALLVAVPQGGSAGGEMTRRGWERRKRQRRLRGRPPTASLAIGYRAAEPGRRGCCHPSTPFPFTTSAVPTAPGPSVSPSLPAARDLRGRLLFGRIHGHFTPWCVRWVLGVVQHPSQGAGFLLSPLLTGRQGKATSSPLAGCLPLAHGRQVMGSLRSSNQALLHA